MISERRAHNQLGDDTLDDNEPVKAPEERSPVGDAGRRQRPLVEVFSGMRLLGKCAVCQARVNNGESNKV